MKAIGWLTLGVLAGCSGLEGSGSAGVTGRLTTRSRYVPEQFTFMGRTYVDRSLCVDEAGGVADAAVYLEGPATTPWSSGRVVMNFGENQFEPRVAFVSPGQPIEIGDSRDGDKHELSVKLEGLTDADGTVFTKGSEPTRTGKPYQVCFDCKDGRWAASGKGHIQRGRTKELVFGKPVLVPLDWD